MTSDKAQIQALINSINEVLNKTSPRLPWVMSNDAAQQRQVLEQTRQYLTSLQQQTEAEPLSLPSGDEGAPRLPAASLPSSSESPSESAQQVLQAVLQEMNYWRVNMLQPLRIEIDSLQRQREMLMQEIRQLESRRQQHSGAQPNQQLVMEFLQSDMAQMQANLSGQVTQIIASQIQSGGQSPGRSALPGALSPQSASLNPAEQLEQMQKSQMQSDQLMLKLDSTLQVIFESLNRNVQTYEQSLEQGLNRMHSLGQQGEAMFAFLVNCLAQQLGREASTFLQAPTPASREQSSASLPATAPAQSEPNLQVPDFLSQVPDSTPSSSFAPAIPFDLSEEVLDISELELIDEPLPEANTLDGLDLALSQLDLSALPPEEPADPSFNLFAGDQPLTPPEATEPTADLPVAASPPAISDLDSALDLLNQLSAEMQSDMVIEPEPIEPTAQPPTLASETELISVPDLLYDEAFYSNLLHDPTADSLPVAPSGVDPTVNPTIDAVTLEQEWFDGLGDPAAELPLEPTPAPDFPGSSVSQSLETFLLSNPAPPSAKPDLFAEFAGSDPSALRTPRSEALGEPAEPTETITSLTDLIPDWDLQASETLGQLDQLHDGDIPYLDDFGFESTLPTVSPASPAESLPIAEAPLENLNVDLGRSNLGPADALAQLGVDLAQPLSPAPTSLPDPTATGWDLFTGLPPTEPVSDTSAPVPTPNPHPPAVTIEGLEDLFEDLPNRSPDLESAPAESTARIEASPDLLAQLKAAFSQDADTPIQAEQSGFLNLTLHPDADSEKKKRCR